MVAHQSTRWKLCMSNKIVELTAGKHAIGAPVYPNDEIELLNPFNFVGRPLPFKDGELGGLFAHYVLNRIPWSYTEGCLEDWARCLATKSLLHVLVPSWEWLSRMVLQEKLEPHIKPLMFGAQTNPHDVGMNAFTMRELRVLFDRVGLAVVKAKVSKVDIEIGEEIYEAEQHYVCGLKETK